MNILFITNNLPPIVDGVGDYTLNLAKEFSRHGHSVSIISCCDERISTEYRDIKILPCVDSWDRSASKIIVDVIRENRVDITLLQYVPHGFHPKGLPLAMIDTVKEIKKSGSKLFVFCHEVYVQPDGWNLKRTGCSLLMQYITKQILIRADYIATSIPFYRELIRGLIGAHRNVGVIPIMSNIPPSKMDREEIAKLRQSIALEDELIVAFFGLRNIKSSIQAIEKLRCGGAKLKILLIGKLPSNLPADLPSDTFKTGILDIDMIDSYFRLSDILILPEDTPYGCSFKSGSLAAALSSGLPIITSKGIMTDDVMVDRESVCFVDFTQEQSIINALEYLRERENRVMVGENARRLMVNRSWEATYREYINIIGGSKRVVISHPTGNANVRGAVDGLFRSGVLHSYHTSVSCFKGSFTYFLSMFPPLKDFRKRVLNPTIERFTYSYPYMELGRMVAIKLKIKSWSRHESGRFCVDRVYSEIDHRVARFIESRGSEFDAVYCYEDCAEETFNMAKRLGKKCIYELPIGYWRTMRRLLEPQIERYPEWAMTLGGFDDSEEKLHRKNRELALAQKIYVASSFTKRSLLDYPGKLADIEVIPYGFPPVNEERIFLPIKGRKIKLLFVGGLSQRKGIANIFEALERLYDRVEFTVVGVGDIDGCKALRRSLSGVRYIPSIPHCEVLTLMATQDVLLFPSLFEGFGLVITESMSQGTPVITTDRTCGADLITHGRDGWIVEAGSSDGLRTQTLELIANPQSIIDAGRESIKRAKQRPWSRYEEELAESVLKFINQ